MSLSPDGNTIAILYQADKVLILYDPADVTPTSTHIDITVPGWSAQYTAWVEYSPDGSRIMAVMYHHGGTGVRLTLHNSTDLSVITTKDFTASWDQNSMIKPRFSKSGHRIAMMDGDKLVMLNSTTDSLTEVLRTTTNPFSGLGSGCTTSLDMDWSADDAYLLITLTCGEVAIYNVSALTEADPSSAMVFNHDFASGGGTYARFSPLWTSSSGYVVVSSGMYNAFYFFGTWEPATGATNSFATTSGPNDPWGGDSDSVPGACNMIPLDDKIVANGCYGARNQLGMWDYSLSPIQIISNTGISARAERYTSAVSPDGGTIYIGGNYGIEKYSPGGVR